ncbi:hypothetical protein AQUCO_00900526v1 [Aquilegia coerulea]|uniref:F-box domain-containing protein n=1 Tax=Aquilegia coerulea TaxID=218851 RepID=A0A2G5EE30_AQUCA|nr:hypothetical protein AQUCO_00900526v1 [Aquilegia coerulea]
MDVNWLKLPDDIIADIFKRLVDIDDYVRFGAVCKSWQSVKQANKRNRFSPWLLLPEGEINTQDHNHNDINNYHIRKFFSLSSRKTLYLNLLETRGRRCFGSPFGWLFTIGLDLNIHLINPLTRIQITFPSQPTFQYQYECHVDPKDMRTIFVPKFALSSINPNADQGNCVVMVIYSQFRKLAFARPGDESWTAIETPPEETHKDVVCFKDQFYAVTGRGKLKICEIDTSQPRTLDFMPPPEDMCGDLHLVVRIFDQDESAPEGVFRYTTIMFEVYKLDFDSMKWIELFDLGDYALFVGTNASFAVLTSDNPEIKRNSIYFTDDQDDCYDNGDGGGHDMGIFYFPNETFESFYLVSNFAIESCCINYDGCQARSSVDFHYVLLRW